jgi:hypothetical protein
MVMRVPPAAEPWAGVTELMTGYSWNRYWEPAERGGAGIQ